MQPGGRGRAQSRHRARHARRRTKAMNAAAVEAAGAGRSPMSHIQNTESELIKKFHDEWCVENGYKPQAPSIKPEDLHVINTLSFKPKAGRKSPKRQATSSKPQAPSRKRQASQ